MTLDIYFIEDVRNAIMAADEASASTARVCAVVTEAPMTLLAYLEGYRAALTTVALAFGLSPSMVRRAPKQVHTKPTEGKATAKQAE